ncbi:MAG: hypothetical protein V1794_01530 [Candidatus Glassbacteria bacterium]
MGKRVIIFLGVAYLLSQSPVALLCSSEPPQPVIHCRTPEPTRDKPQSKLWYGRGHWWAWLPDGESESRVWRRDGDGKWVEREHLSAMLSSLPGRADVTSDEDRVVAVLVGGKRIAVAALAWNAVRGRYELERNIFSLSEESEIETVTIAAAPSGFWIAYPLDSAKGRQVVVRKVSHDLISVGEKVVLADSLSRDDICAVTRTAEGVGVMWSDQNRDMLLFRRHLPGAPDTAWSPADTVDRNNKTADDHINFARPSAGSGGPNLIAATKTSLDTYGQPLLSLRVNKKGRLWVSVPFALLTKRGEPSRPIALWYGIRPLVIYTLYGPAPDSAKLNRIMLQQFSADALDPLGTARELIPPLPGLNDVTGAKQVPDGVPLVVLASDAGGEVYEAVITP